MLFQDLCQIVYYSCRPPNNTAVINDGAHQAEPVRLKLRGSPSAVRIQDPVRAVNYLSCDLLVSQTS